MRSGFKVASLLGVIAGFILLSGTIRGSVLNSLSMCATVLLPALFPFFVLSGLLYDFGLDVLMPPAWCGFWIGAVCGYPLGARAVCAYYKDGKLDRLQANRLLMCSSGASPAFLVAAVGSGLLHSTKTGYLLLAAQFLSALVLFLCAVPQKTDRVRPRVCSGALLPTLIEGTHNAVKQMLFVCAMTVFCGIFADLSVYYLPYEGTAKALIAGSIEILHGVALLKDGTQVLAAAAMVGMSGLCVWAQCAYFIGQTDLGIRYLVLGKLYQTAALPLFYLALIRAPFVVLAAVFAVLIFVLTKRNRPCIIEKKEEEKYDLFKGY